MTDILNEAYGLIQCKECPWYKSCVMPMRFTAETYVVSWNRRCREPAPPYRPMPVYRTCCPIWPRPRRTHCWKGVHFHRKTTQQSGISPTTKKIMQDFGSRINNWKALNSNITKEKLKLPKRIAHEYRQNS